MHSAISKLKKKHAKNEAPRKCQGQGCTEKNFNHLPVHKNYDTVN